jgi:hypothetical protein
MITNFLVLFIVLHWSFATGAMIAARTKITTGQFLMGIIFFRYTLYSYGL